MTNQQWVERYRSDEFYYSKEAPHLSASTIKKYLKGINPPEDNPNTEALTFGHAFHQSILEEDKYLVRSDISQEQRDHINMLKSCLQHSHEYEVMKSVTDVEKPFVGSSYGLLLKCKVDAETPKYLVDLKTTSNIDTVEFTGKHWGYHISAYQYWLLTGKIMYFLYVEKITGRIKLVIPDKKFYQDGRRDWIWAAKQYKKAQQHQWEYLTDHTMEDQVFTMDKVHFKTENNKLYGYLRKPEFQYKRK